MAMPFSSMMRSTMERSSAFLLSIFPACGGLRLESHHEALHAWCEIESLHLQTHRRDHSETSRVGPRACTTTPKAS